jgi:hypothetical protein
MVREKQAKANTVSWISRCEARRNAPMPSELDSAHHPCMFVGGRVVTTSVQPIHTLKAQLRRADHPIQAALSISKNEQKNGFIWTSCQSFHSI